MQRFWEETVKPNWRRWLPVALLLALALTYRLCILFSLQGDPFVATPILDSAAYDSWGMEIATKSFWGDRVFYQDPLYPYMLGIFYKLFGHHLAAVKVIQALVATVGLWMLFEAGRRTMGYAAALGALALAALYQTTAFYDVMLLKEFLGPFFIEAALLCAAMNGRWWAGAGLSLGLAALVRGNLLAVIPLVIILLCARKEWRSAGLVAAGAAFAILPCAIRNYAVSRELVLTTAQGGQNFYIGNNETNWTGRYVPPPFMRPSPLYEESDFRTEAQRRSGRPLTSAQASSSWWGEAFGAIGKEPGSFAAATGRRTMLLLNAVEVPDNFSIPFMRRYSWALFLPPMGFGLILAPLAAGGIYLAWIERKKHALLFVVLAGTLVPLAFFFVFDRYRLPVLPALWLFGGYGMARYVELRSKGFVAINRTAVAVAAAMLVIAHLPIVSVDFAVPWRNLAKYHLDRNETASAVEAAQHMLDAKPELWKDVTSVALMAACYEGAGKRGDALAAWKRSAEATQAVEAWGNVGRLYASMGDWAKAVDAYAKALPLYRVERAEAMAKQNQLWEAVEALKIAVQEQRGSVKPVLALARTYFSMGMWRESHDWAGKAVEMEPMNREAIVLRAEAAAKIK